MNPSLPSVLHNVHGERLEFTVHSGAAHQKTLVLLGHGVTGNKDRPLLVELAHQLAAAGVHVLRFSFSGNGGSEGRFVDSTISKEVQDLGSIIDALPGWTLGYAGHSMGGAVGVLRASQDPRLKFLISLAGMAHTAAFAEREFGTLIPGAALMWDKPECPLSQAWVDDLNQIGSVREAAARVKVPWLLVHGVVDDVVPVQDSRDLFAVAHEPKQLIEFPEADHVFSDQHGVAMAKAVTGWVGQLS